MISHCIPYLSRFASVVFLSDFGRTLCFQQHVVFSTRHRRNIISFRTSLLLSYKARYNGLPASPECGFFTFYFSINRRRFKFVPIYYTTHFRICTLTFPREKSLINLFYKKFMSRLRLHSCLFN